MNKDGSGQTNLSQSKKNEYNPCWSPQGDKIAFQSLREKNVQIYTMNPDGSNQTKITNSLDYNNSGPIWSSDGSMLICTTIHPPHEFKNSIVFIKNDSVALLKFGEDSYNYAYCFSEDNKRILCYSITGVGYYRTSKLFTYDISTNTSTIIKKNIDNLKMAKFLNEDSIILETKENLLICDLKKRKMKKIYTGVDWVTCSPKEDLLLFAWNGHERDICTIRTFGKGFKNLTKGK
jgi:tricorn protease-like protein